MDEYRDIGLYDGKSGFLGAIGKIGRARYLLADLNRRFQAFAEREPYQVGGNYEPQSTGEFGEYVFRIEKPRVPNREWGVLVGEIVHHLRSALDQAVFAASSTPSRDNGFPVCRSEADWEEGSPALLQGVPPAAVSMCSPHNHSGMAWA